MNTFFFFFSAIGEFYHKLKKKTSAKLKKDTSTCKTFSPQKKSGLPNAILPPLTAKNKEKKAEEDRGEVY